MLEIPAVQGTNCGIGGKTGRSVAYRRRLADETWKTRRVEALEQHGPYEERHDVADRNL